MSNMIHVLLEGFAGTTDIVTRIVLLLCKVGIEWVFQLIVAHGSSSSVAMNLPYLKKLVLVMVMIPANLTSLVVVSSWIFCRLSTLTM